jgi:hypothetical protein
MKFNKAAFLNNIFNLLIELPIFGLLTQTINYLHKAL